MDNDAPVEGETDFPPAVGVGRTYGADRKVIIRREDGPYGDELLILSRSRRVASGLCFGKSGARRRPFVRSNPRGWIGIRLPAPSAPPFPPSATADAFTTPPCGIERETLPAVGAALKPDEECHHGEPEHHGKKNKRMTPARTANNRGRDEAAQVDFTPDYTYIWRGGYGNWRCKRP